MKVALLDLTPFWGGVVKWGTYLVEELGIDYLAWNKPKFNLDALPIDITVMKGSDEKRLEILDQYDFVLVASLHFEITQKQREYQILKQCRVPWTFMVHNFHKFNRDPEYIRDLFDDSKFIGKVITTSPEFVDDIQTKLLYHLDSILLPYLPYRRICDDIYPEGKDVIMTSRVLANKGSYPLVYVMQGFGKDVRLHGSTYNLMSGIPQSHILREKIIELREEDHRIFTGVERNEYWSEYLPTGELIRYMGAYDDFRDVMYDSMLHVNLTSNTLATGHLEYVTLEAMDYGLPVIVPDSHVSDLESYQVFKVDNYMRPGKYDKDALKDTLKRALTSTQDEKREMVKHNRKMLDEYYNPTVYAKEIEKLWK